MATTSPTEQRLAKLEHRVDALAETLKHVIAALESSQAKRKLDFSSITGHRELSR